MLADNIWDANTIHELRRSLETQLRGIYHVWVIMGGHESTGMLPAQKRPTIQCSGVATPEHSPAGLHIEISVFSMCIIHNFHVDVKRAYR